MADAPLSESGPAVRAREASERARLTVRRIFGFDRSGPPPPETLAGHPLNPWTLPNLIVALRLAGIPVFLIFALASGDGTTVTGALLYWGLAISDYLDGITARITGQYSRLGAIMDPLTDRLLVVTGLAVCWRFDLLPRWALAVLVARELFMLALARYGMRHDLELGINWFGRFGIWWTLGAPFWAMMDVQFLALLGLYVGLALTLVATALYVRDGVAQLRARR
ncbi:MAG: CDP-alcohol phosphatidyltransferase family protein [Solirubrobacteraceae bacterium]